MIQPGVTIMICCHNGAARLPQTIKHIACQEVPNNIPWEFIIIDNKSTDNSAMLARREWAKYVSSARFRIVLEPNLGLSYARSRGFLEARYEFVLMCDDDNWLEPDYVRNVYQIMQERPQIAALGGLGKLIFEIDPPKYIKIANIFAAGEQAGKSGKVPDNKIYGAGCVIRKSAYQKLYDIGFRSLLVDRKGRELSSGGDYELCYALAILGYDVWYDERLRFSHFITKERLTIEYFLRYAKESSKCFDVLASYKSIAENSFINKLTFLHIARNFFYFLRRFIKVNAKRLVTGKESDEARMLLFRHVVLKYKLRAFAGRFYDMIRIHTKIAQFKETCEASHGLTKLVNGKVYKPEFEITSFSQPSQPLQQYSQGRDRIF